MKIGDIVSSIDPANSDLHCSHWKYPHAVVICLEPFVLVSEETDMRWGAIKPNSVKVIGKASSKILKYCMRRLKK